MSGNLCRCGAYAEHRAGDRRRCGRDEAVRATSAPPTRTRAVAALGARPARGPLPRRRHEPRRPHAARRRDARRCSSTSPGCRTTRSSRSPTAACASAPPCATATCAADPLVRERYPVLSPGPAGGRVGPAAQPRHGRRQPAPAHALPVLPGRHEAVQQARAGSGCPAREGDHRNLAILGHSDACVATHPSDMAVALAALDARVHVRGPDGERTIPMPGLHRLPGDEPERDTVLGHGELITAVELPAPAVGRPLALPQGARPRLLRLRGRLGRRRARRRRDGAVRDARIALGGVAHEPWRAPRRRGRACAARPPTEESFARRGRRRAGRRPSRCATTPSRCRWRAT